MTGENYFVDDEVHEMIDKLYASLKVHHKYVTTLESMKKSEFYDITRTSSTPTDSSPSFSTSPTPINPLLPSQAAQPPMTSLLFPLSKK